jgi:ribosome-associated protein
MKQMAVEMARIAADDKCSDVVILDLQGLSTVTDYFVIATGTSDRQLRSVVDHMREWAKGNKIRPIGLDGYDSSHWVLIDFGAVVVHVFSPSYRELYDLELLWGDAPKVRWQRRVVKKKAATEEESS